MSAVAAVRDGKAVGNRVRVKVVKNKVAAPFRQAEFEIEFGKGISASGCLLGLGVRFDIVSKSGTHYSYGQERLGQGLKDASAFLDDHPTIARKIEDGVYAAAGLGVERTRSIERDRDGAESPPLSAEPLAAAA